MDISELEENLFAACDAKLHGGMCKTLATIYCKVLSVFPSLEDARPRSRSGIQALCSLHIALEKAKTVLQHCSECSKLYLAITGDSVLSKFEKARSALKDSLKRVEDIVPQSIGCQIEEILSDLEGAEFSLDQSEKQVGDEIIALLQQGRKFDSSVDCTELESFHQAATKLGITSSRAALTERRALKKLIERARVEEDKRKESIVAYLLHLMRKYSKLFRSSEVSDDNDSQSSTPCSPTVQGSAEDNVLGGNGHVFERQLSKLSSFNFKPNVRSGQMPVAPEELRCPISLQIMYDPVIISSGQTYERICIEKWLSDGHNSCPKTQQQLSHTGLTPNYCVKGLIASWCEQNGVPSPSGPPESLDLNYWRLALSECESTKSKSMDSVRSCKSKGVKVVPLEESCIKEETEEHGRENVSGNLSINEEDSEVNELERYKKYLAVLNEQESLERRCKVVEQIRIQLKDDEEARISMGANGFVEALFRFLESAFNEGNSSAQDVGAMALFNLAVNNNRNKEMMLATGVIPLLEKMISNTTSHGSATALYLNLSCFEEAKPIIGSSQAVPFLVQQLQADKAEPLCKLDSLHALFHLSTHPPNVPKLISAGIIDGLLSILPTWTEKGIAVLINLATTESGKQEMSSNSSLISGLATVLDSGEPSEQEQAVSCLLILCNRNEKCCQMVLQEGVIPGLVSVSVNGTARGKEKAQKLLMLFREQRQRDQSQSQSEPEPEPVETCHQVENFRPVNEIPIPKSGREPKHITSKSISKRTMGKALSFLWKSKSHSSLKSYS